VLCLTLGLVGWGNAFGQGETCATAVPVVPGTFTADGPATGGGALAAAGCFGAADATNADWYSFTSPITGTAAMDIRSCIDATAPDTRFSVYSGTCGALTCVAQSDDDCGLSSEVAGVDVVAGTTYYIEWDDRWETTGFDWELTVVGFVACPNPPVSGLSVSGITETAADVNFTSGGATVYVEYGLPGFTPGFDATAGGGTVVSGLTSPISITGLTGATAYDVYVREDCGANVWTNVQIGFSTLCVGPSALPYTENVDGAAVPLLPPCLSQIDDGLGETWQSATAGAGFSGNVMQINTDATNAHDDWIFLRPIANPGLGQTIRVQWLEGQNGAGTNNFEVRVSSAPSAGPGTAFSVSTAAGVATLNFLDEIITFSGDIFVGFHATSAAGNPALILDNFFVDIAPTCETPGLPTISNDLGSSVDVDFTCAGCLGTFEVEYGLTGFVQGSAGGTIIAGASSPINISGLSGLTDYDVYVRQDCGAGNLSFWTAPATTFTTGCVAFVAPYNEGFDTPASPSGTPPLCFSTSATSGSGWEFDGPTGFNTVCGAPGNGSTGTGSFAFVDFSTGNDVNVVMELPIVDVSGLTSPQLDFDRFMCVTTNAPNPVFFEYFDGSAWIVLETFSTGTAVTGSGAAGWQEEFVNLSPAVVAGNVQLRFRAEDGGGPSSFNGDSGIDEIAIREAPTCPQVDNGSFAAGNETTTSFDASWTCTGCTGTFGVIYGAPGFDPATAGTTILGPASPITVTGLTANTPFDVYVFQDCGLGDISDTTGAISVRTLCAPMAPPFFDDFSTYADTDIPPCYAVFNGANTTTATQSWQVDNFRSGHLNLA